MLNIKITILYYFYFSASNELAVIPDEILSSLASLCCLFTLQGALNGHLHGCEGFWQGCHGYADRDLAEKLSGKIKMLQEKKYALYTWG